MTDTLTAEELADIAALVGPPSGATAAEVGEYLGLAAPRISALAREGRIPRRGDGSFDLKPTIRAYVESLRQKGTSALAQNPELNAEKIRIARASAEKIEVQNAKAKGNLLAATEVEKAWSAILRDVRAGVLAAPSRIGSRLPHLSAHDLTEINRELTAVLAELADGE